MSTNVLHMAAAIVDGNREGTHGDPGKNLRAIADFWTAWLRARGLLPNDAALDTNDVAYMMVGLKLARLAHDPTHKDSQVDACGYVRLAERTQQTPTGNSIERPAPTTQPVVSWPPLPEHADVFTIGAAHP